MVRFTLGLTGWVDRCSFSAIPVIRIVCVGIVRNPSAGVRVCLPTVIVFVAIAGTIRVVLGLVFFSFELTALVSVVTWLFAVVASWFGFFGDFRVVCYVTVNICSSCGASKPFNSNSLSGCETFCYTFKSPDAPG